MLLVFTNGVNPRNGGHLGNNMHVLKMLFWIVPGSSTGGSFVRPHGCPPDENDDRCRLGAPVHGGGERLKTIPTLPSGVGRRKRVLGMKRMSG